MRTVHDTRHIIHGTPYTVLYMSQVIYVLTTTNNSNSNHLIVLRVKTETEKKKRAKCTHRINNQGGLVHNIVKGLSSLHCCCALLTYARQI